jgi:hypothetical protein
MTQDQSLVTHPAHAAIRISVLMRKTTEATRPLAIDQHHDEP